jgi:hypothetical protein
MPPKNDASNSKVEELLNKLIAINMWTADATQDVIAARLGKSKGWVNNFLRGVPKSKSSKLKE